MFCADPVGYFTERNEKSDMETTVRSTSSRKIYWSSEVEYGSAAWRGQEISRNIRSCPEVLPVDNISITDIRFPSEASLYSHPDPLLLHLNVAFSVLSTAVCFQGIIPEGPRTMWLTRKYTCPTRFSFITHFCRATVRSLVTRAWATEARAISIYAV